MKHRLLFSSLLLGATLTVASCGDRTTTGLSPAVGPVEASRLESHKFKNAGLARCKPLPPARALKRIGPEGGVVIVGPYVLTIPPGALANRVWIWAQIPHASSFNVVAFQPEGLVFQQPASLAMSYANCHLSADAEPLQIAFVDREMHIGYYLGSVDDTLSQTVTGIVQHFSSYAVAY